MLNVDDRYSQNVRNAEFGEDVQSSIVLGVFINGDSVIQNVPYSKHVKHSNTPSDKTNSSHDELGKEDAATYDLYLTHDVLYQLSQIIKLMQKENIQTVDYQRFIIANSRLLEKDGYGSSSDVCLTLPDTLREDSGLSTKTLSKSSNVIELRNSTKEKSKRNENKDDDTKALIRKNVVDKWLKNYWDMHLQAKAAPSIHNNGINKKTGKTKAEEAAEWLTYFHERLDELPELERRIIEKKFLDHHHKRQYPLDEIIICELHIGQRNYYYRKKEALYLLGLALGDN